MTTPPSIPELNLEQLLSRSDIWRGDTYSPASLQIRDSGFPELNAALLQGGWPTSSLIEICQKELQHLEWMIFLPTLKKIEGYIALINPPGIPFCQAFIQAEIDLERIIVVQTTNKADFLAAFSELARTLACDALFAWQQHALSYTELRKCLLASNENTGMCVLFRPENAQQQSSPSGLRLHAQISHTQCELNIFKQKGTLKTSTTKICLPLAGELKGFFAHALLDQSITPKKSNILSLKRSKQ